MIFRLHSVDRIILLLNITCIATEGIFTARKRSLREGYVFTGVCDSVNRGGMLGFIWGGVCGFIRGDMRGFIRGACVVLFRGACVVLFRGACVVLSGGWGRVWFYGGACMVLFGGCVVLSGGWHAWFYWGAVHGFSSFFGYNEIWSMSGRNASYWNAFLFSLDISDALSDAFNFFRISCMCHRAVMELP